MPKLLRKRKQFGRCGVKGHGQNAYCEVMSEIQETAFTRAQEVKESKSEIEIGLAEFHLEANTIQ